MDDTVESPQRWTAKCRATLVLSLLRGETSAQAAAQSTGSRWPRWRSSGTVSSLKRFATLRPRRVTPVGRSDNGLIYQSQRFRAACRDYRLTQEFFTPYTPEQSGMIECFFRSLKEECLWQHTFVSFEHARRELSAWIYWYNEKCPHQALGNRNPARVPDARNARDDLTLLCSHLSTIQETSWIPRARQPNPLRHDIPRA